MSQSSPPPFLAALQKIDELQRGAELIALLGAALANGLLQQLMVPSEPVVNGVDDRQLRAALGLLASYGVIEESSQGWQLTPAWLPVVAGSTPFDLEAALGLGRVRTEQVGLALTGGRDYWRLDTADRVMVARGMSFDPATQMSVAMARRDLEDLPEVIAALEAGGRVLELGCGLGSRMSALLQGFPTARAVGVELAEDLVVAGRARAARLGVADRLTYVCADVTSYRPDGLFDVVAWSQFFFPEPTRAGALVTALAALRPGGWITMPVIWDGSALEPGSLSDQEMAAERLLLSLWNVPLRTTAEVEQELLAAGFVDTRVDSGPVVHFVRGRKPT